MPFISICNLYSISETVGLACLETTPSNDSDGGIVGAAKTENSVALGFSIVMALITFIQMLNAGFLAIDISSKKTKPHEAEATPYAGRDRYGYGFLFGALLLINYIATVVYYTTRHHCRRRKSCHTVVLLFVAPVNDYAARQRVSAVAAVDHIAKIKWTQRIPHFDSYI
ncbi:hypothetical protein M422DRAFT_776502 [Sphaerobolus stellatus SS14]|nr:hypothetical protein M422DRAFT_776502 [Sphaerobolus stellatus SS14]